MKPAKYILLFSFAMILIGIIGKSVPLFENAELFLSIGLIIHVITSIVYGISALIYKKHRIEAGMITLAIPLTAGIVLSLLRWPGGNVLIVLGSGILSMGAFVMLTITLVKNHKIALGILYVAIGFGGLFFCFKFMRWPGAAIMFFPAAITTLIAFVFLFIKKETFTMSKIISLLIIALITGVFFTSSSQLYRIKHINVFKPERNLSENYYTYAWLLNKEGKKEEARSNLQLAIQAVANPYNLNENPMTDVNSATERYRNALNLLENDQWKEKETPMNNHF